MQKGEHGLAPLEVFYPFSFWHHTLSSFFFVDLSVDLVSNWHGVEAMRNLGPVEDLSLYKNVLQKIFLNINENNNDSHQRKTTCTLLYSQKAKKL